MVARVPLSDDMHLLLYFTFWIMMCVVPNAYLIHRINDRCHRN